MPVLFDPVPPVTGVGPPIAVLHLIEESTPNPWLVDIVERTDRDRWRPIVASVQPSGQLQRDVLDAGGAIAALGARSRRGYPLAAARLRWFAHQHGVRLVHAHNFGPALLTMAAGVALRPYAWLYTYFQQPDFFRLAPTKPWKRAILITLDREIARRAGAIVAPSRHVRDVLVRDGIRPEKIHEIVLGFDIDSLQERAARALEAVLREFGVGEGLCAVSVGRLSWEKDHATLLRAWRGIADDHPGARLILVGQGPLRGQLIALAAELGIADAVTFAGPRRDVPAIMAAADVVVHTAVTESFGQVLAEALALGRPLVTTNVGVARHFRDRVHCLTVPQGDAEAIREAVRGLVAKPALAREIGERGRAFIRSEFTIERNVRAFERLYASLLCGGDGASA